MDPFQAVRAEDRQRLFDGAATPRRSSGSTSCWRSGSAEAPYLGGQEYSIADIATFPWTRNHDAQGVKWEDNPNLARWFNAIDERPAVKAALAKIAAIKSNRETASDDDKDRFFNRGKPRRA